MASRDYVVQQYQELLGRAPDAGGLKHYMGYGDPNAIRSEIMGSAEYRQRQASKTAAPPAPVGPDPATVERQRLEGEVSGLFGELGALDANAQAPVDVYNKALESLGLVDARSRVVNMREQLMNSESLLRNVESDVSGRTQGANVSEAQRRRLVAKESEPLAGQVDVMGRALEGAMADYGMVLGEGKTQAELTFQGEREKRTALMDRLQIAINRATNAEDRRRWEAELVRLKEKDAEATRQFNAQLALEQQQLAVSAAKGSGGSGGGSSSTRSAQAKAQGEVSNYILTSGQRGRDGYISPVTYKQLKSEWIDAGYTAGEFDSAFRMYANPKHLQDYGLR